MYEVMWKLATELLEMQFDVRSGCVLVDDEEGDDVEVAMEAAAPADMAAAHAAAADVATSSGGDDGHVVAPSAPTNLARRMLRSTFGFAQRAVRPMNLIKGIAAAKAD